MSKFIVRYIFFITFCRDYLYVRIGPAYSNNWLSRALYVLQIYDHFFPPPRPRYSGHVVCV